MVIKQIEINVQPDQLKRSKQAHVLSAGYKYIIVKNSYLY